MTHIRRLILFAFLTMLTLQLSAQDMFNEMTYTKKYTIFRVIAPTSPTPQMRERGIKPHVTLRLYDRGEGGKLLKTVKMKPQGEDRWVAKVRGNLKGWFYTFDMSNGETAGVFAKAVGVNGKRGAIIDLKETDPAGWAQDKRLALRSPADLVIYELHHRDFSIDSTSGLRYKGKFLALTEPKAIDYLKNLGVNAVHILPSFDFASVDERRLDKPQYNWGYDPLNYNVPEGSYSTDPFTPATRIKEFKQMVEALHKAGIRVILDVVYNHTFDVNGSGFHRTYPGKYYRHNADGSYSDGSGCGNETASDNELMRRFMIESMRYWAKEYHVDGFRVDLMGVHDIATMNAIRAALDQIDPSIFVYGEGWSAGRCAYPAEHLAMKANIGKMPRIAAFSDEIRDALRGPFSDDTKGAFLAGVPGQEESLKYGIAGAIAHPGVDMSKVNYSKTPFAQQPTQMISYASCHDDMCLTDRLRASVPNATEAELIRMDLLAQTAVFTSQGVPFMLSGEEMFRDKKGVHNSYNSPDSINHLDWDNLKRYPQVFDYYRQLIKLRHDHPAFRLGDADAVRRHLEFLPTHPCLVGYVLKNHAGGDSWDNIIVILNGNKEAREVTIPQGKYTIVCCDDVINQQGLGTVTGNKVIVDGRSALILHD